MIQFILVYVSLMFPSYVLATASISNPELLFSPSALTTLEQCFIDETIIQSPHGISRLLPVGTLRYAKDDQGNLLEIAAEILAAGVSSTGERYGYRLQFYTLGESKWHPFQQGQNIGMYSEEMDVEIPVLDHESGKHIFTVDVSSCAVDL